MKRLFAVLVLSLFLFGGVPTIEAAAAPVKQAIAKKPPVKKASKKATKKHAKRAAKRAKKQAAKRSK